MPKYCRRLASVSVSPGMSPLLTLPLILLLPLLIWLALLSLPLLLVLSSLELLLSLLLLELLLSLTLPISALLEGADGAGGLPSATLPVPTRSPIGGSGDVTKLSPFGRKRHENSSYRGHI